MHVPFCVRRCGYCNFSITTRRDDLARRFLDAIAREIDAELAAARAAFGAPSSGDPRFPLGTLFIGGGTPSHLSNQDLECLLKTLRDRFAVDQKTEITLEANPEDVNGQRIELWKHLGINRISMGVQSFDDEKLRTLERGHTGEQAREAIRCAAQQIENVSIDLIFAAPGETPRRWMRDLDTALSLPIRHLSTYALTFEKGTRFWSRRLHGDLAEVDEDHEATMYESARHKVAAAGLAGYEVSSFASPGFRCRHNLAYWKGEPWFAFGPAAASFVAGARRVNHRSVTNYLKRIEAGQSAIAENETIPPHQYAREIAAFGVRMMDGIGFDEIHRKSGVDIRTIADAAIAWLRQHHLITDDKAILQLTDRGILFADTVASRLLNDEAGTLEGR
ncbi:MAG: radical SAM family heme chaperone HemW [Planctomycetota bacterium]